MIQEIPKRELEDTYLQILAASVPKIRVENLDRSLKGFFVLADWDNNRLRFIPHPEITLKPSVDNKAYVKKLLSIWGIAEGQSLHQRVLNTAICFLENSKTLADHCTTFLSSTAMPLSGSLLEKKIFSTYDQCLLSEETTNRPFFVINNYPNELNHPGDKDDFWNKSIPVLVSEYLVGLKGLPSELINPDLNNHAILAPVYALGQARGAAVWFHFTDAYDTEKFTPPLLDLHFLDSFFSAAITDIFVAELLLKLGSLTQREEASTILDALWYLYLCTEVKCVEPFSQKLWGKATWNAKDRKWIKDTTCRQLQCGEVKSAADIQLKLDANVAKAFGFSEVWYTPAYSSTSSDSSPLIVNPVLQRLVNRKLESVVLVADQAHQVIQHRKMAETGARNYRFVAHSLKNTIDRGLPSGCTNDEIRRLLCIEKLIVEGMGALSMPERAKHVDWLKSGYADESIGEVLAKGIGMQFGVNIILNDEDIRELRVKEHFVALIVELLRNILKHDTRKDKFDLNFNINCSELHGMPHISFNLQGLAEVRDAWGIIDAWTNENGPATRGLQTIQEIAKMLCCKECGSLIWRFEHKQLKENSERHENPKKGEWPCYVEAPPDVMNKDANRFGDLNLYFEGIGLFATQRR